MTAKKKQSIPPVPRGENMGFNSALKQCVEVIMGRRGGKITPAREIDAAPTQSDFNELVRKLNSFIEQVQD